jgi:hypothetical protein
MFYNKEESVFNRYFGGGGGKSPKVPVTEPVETKRVETYAAEEELKARKRTPPGKKQTMFSGIKKALEERSGLKKKLGR